MHPLSWLRHCLSAMVFTLAAGALPAVEVGGAAPDFSLQDSEGRSVSLSSYRGKVVVLEWFNPGCPFVVKFYGSQSMQAQQKLWTERGVVWLLINSTHPGHRDFLDAAATRTLRQSWSIDAAASLLDPTGAVGRAYGARTTPHLFVIDGLGVLAYAGAIDDQPSTRPEDIARAHNYVAAALEALLAHRPVPVSRTKPYGCGVKYAD